MMRSLFSGVSGLKSHQTRMDSIGNNIANVNTTGYKSSRVTFADTLYQTSSGAAAPSGNLGGVNPKQIGLGVGVAAVDTIFTDSSPQSTGKNTDLALSGNGLFTVKNGKNTYYTRDGNFSMDGGYQENPDDQTSDRIYRYVNSAGYTVQGYLPDSEGKIKPNGVPTDIAFSEKEVYSLPGAATASAQITGNLNASITGLTPTSALIKYADGSSETTGTYTPSIMDSITVTGTDAGTYVVPSAGTTPAYSTGDTLTNATIWSSKATEVNLKAAGGNRALELGGAAAAPYTFINGVKFSEARIHVPAAQIIPGTYHVDDTYTVNKTIQTATLNTADHTVTLTFTSATDGISSVTVPNPQGNTYTAGAAFAVSLRVVSATADVGDDVTCENGKTATLQAGETAKLGDNYDKKISGTVASVTDHVGYYYKGKKVDSLVLQGADVNTAGDITKSLTDQTIPGSVVTIFKGYDSQGGSVSIPLILWKTGANNWTPKLTNGSNTYTFKREDGVEVEATLTADDVVFDTSGKYVSGKGTIDVKYKGGSSMAGLPAPNTITIDFSTLTQYAGSSTVKSDCDGNAAGNLTSISIDTSGVITGTYTNGQIKSLAQVAIAQFNNASGLTRIGGNLFQVSNNSGSARYGAAEDLGAKITPSALEMSNVDIANEFSDMIITQRGFQSNSKIITVGDEMLETLINMKR